MTDPSSRGRDSLVRRIVPAGGLCLLLAIGWGLVAAGAAAGQKGKPPSNKCNHLTAAAVFRDASTDGVKSDGQFVYPYPAFGSPSEYHGWEDSAVCLMMFDDYDFIMGTSGTIFEKNGWNRMVALDFAANPNPSTPFNPLQTVEVSIRSDYIFNLAEPGPVNRRLILWFTANGTDYKLYFDDADGADMVQATVTGTAEARNRVWTIESSGYGRLEGPRKTGIVGYFLMPFKITIHETSYPNTCF